MKMGNHEDPLPTTGAATGAHRELDADRIFLLECMEIDCDEVRTPPLIFLLY